MFKYPLIFVIIFIAADYANELLGFSGFQLTSSFVVQILLFYAVFLCIELREYKYLLILSSWIAIFLVGALTPQPDGSWYFGVQALWSLAVISVILYIQFNKLTHALVIAEFSIILENVFACIEYLTTFGFYYEKYGVILDVIAVIEILTFIVGAPRDGIRRRFQGLWWSSTRTYRSGYSLIQADAIAYQERSRREHAFRCRR